MPRALSGFEIEAFFTFTVSEPDLIKAPRRRLKKNSRLFCGIGRGLNLAHVEDAASAAGITAGFGYGDSCGGDCCGVVLSAYRPEVRSIHAIEQVY